MAQGPAAKPGDQWQSVPFLVAMGVSLAVLSAVIPIRIVDSWTDQSPIRAWIAVTVGALAIATLLVASIRSGSRVGTAVIASTIPGTVGTAVIRFSDPNPAWAQALRATGIIAAISISLGAALWSARKYKELDRLLFTEATSIAFFVTLVAAGAYGVLQSFFDLPDLSFAWIPLIGAAAWGVAAFLFHRRYT